MSSFDRELTVYRAKLAEQAERFDDMVAEMREVAIDPQELSVEERNLFSVAYKNVIGSRRASWSNVKTIEKNGELSARLPVIQLYKAKIESEISAICVDILSVIKDHLIPKSSSESSMVFYYKMKGDYNRYLAEFQQDDKRDASTTEALEAYQAASTIASSHLAPTHPVRLGLALNFSVFYFEILESPDRACHEAKKAFDAAIEVLDLLSESEYKDATLIMQMLRDNLVLWTAETKKVETVE